MKVDRRIWTTANGRSTIGCVDHVLSSHGAPNFGCRRTCCRRMYLEATQLGQDERIEVIYAQSVATPELLVVSAGLINGGCRQAGTLSMGT